MKSGLTLTFLEMIESPEESWGGPINNSDAD
jgi:hypothetical protein